MFQTTNQGWWLKPTPLKKIRVRQLVLLFPYGKIKFMFQSPPTRPTWWISTWPWVKTYNAIFGWMNIHVPSILMFTHRCQGFDPLPYGGSNLI